MRVSLVAALTAKIIQETLYMRGTGGIALILSSLCVSSPAFAQATSNAITGANDAFGFKKGDEAIGIYDETSARGFSLEAAGNYRFHGTYFVKNSGVSSFFLDSTSVRVGFNTLPVVLPSPSGVVDYALRDPARGEPSLVTIGLDYYSQPYVDVLLKHRSSNAPFAGAFGVNFVPQMTDKQGGSGGSSILIGGTARFTPGPMDLRVFGGEYRYSRPSQFRLITESNLLDRRMKRHRFIGLDKLHDEGQRRIAGVLADLEIDDQLGAGTTAVVSQEDPSVSFLPLFSNLSDDGRISASIVATPAQRTTSLSSELRAYWNSESGSEQAHRIDAIGRFRRTRSSFGGATIHDLGRVFFDTLLTGERIDFLPNGRANLGDHIRQLGAGLAYRGIVGRTRMNAGLLRTSYRKVVGGEEIEDNELQTSAWLYNFSAAHELSDRLTIYGGLSRGLEEAGVAPASATNRYEVLPPATARQYEVAAIVKLHPDFKLVVGAFDLQRGYFGADDLGAVRKLGDVRHRGIELSAAGKLASKLTVVLGGVALDPLVITDSDSRDDFQPIGVPKLKLLASGDYELVPGVHADAMVQFTSSRPATFEEEVPPSWLMNVGARFPLKLARMPTTLRLQLYNLLNDYSWEVSSAGTMAYGPSRTFRLALTTEF
jgi:iron complex outermembrane receptor protein